MRVFRLARKRLRGAGMADAEDGHHAQNVGNTGAASARREMLARLGAVAMLVFAPGCAREAISPITHLPAITLDHLYGNEKWLSTSVKGPLLINFWATWCAPCRSEMASLEALYRELAPLGLNMVGISVDRDVRLAQEFATAQRLSFVNLHDPDRRVSAAALGIQVLPTTLLVDPHRRIVARVERAEHWSSVDTREWIARLVALPSRENVSARQAVPHTASNSTHTEIK